MGSVSALVSSNIRMTVILYSSIFWYAIGLRNHTLLPDGQCSLVARVHPITHAAHMFVFSLQG